MSQTDNGQNMLKKLDHTAEALLVLYRARLVHSLGSGQVHKRQLALGNRVENLVLGTQVNGEDQMRPGALHEHQIHFRSV